MCGVVTILWHPVPEADLVLEGVVTRKVARRWAVQIAEAMEFVHSCGVLHNHLDSRSILLAHSTRLGLGLQPKVADFMLATLEDPSLTRDQTREDVVAFGSLLFEIVTGRHVGQTATVVIWGKYNDMQSDLEALGLGVPDTGSLGGLGEVVRSCWACYYSGFDEVVKS